MTKQEEIREGLKQVEFLRWDASKFYLTDSYIDRIFDYLHSQGVVIKVEDGEDSMILINIEDRDYANEIFLPIKVSNIKKAGYDAFEPLIEEVRNAKETTNETA